MLSFGNGTPGSENELHSNIPFIDNGLNWFRSLLNNGSSSDNTNGFNDDEIYFRPNDPRVKELIDKLGIGAMTNATKEYLLEYMLNEDASEAAWNRSVFASQNQYQWLKDDLQKAGLNPFLALSGLNAAQATSSAQGVSGGLAASRRNNSNTNETAMMKALMTAIASIIGIALFKRA